MYTISLGRSLLFLLEATSERLQGVHTDAKVASKMLYAEFALVFNIVSMTTLSYPFLS